MSRRKQAPPPTNRAWGYVRVSTDRQAEQGHSLPAQETKIRAYCTYRDLTLEALLVDDGVSAGKLRLGQRPAGSKLMLSVQPGDHVIVTKLDRGWRNAEDALGILNAWHEQGITLHLLDCSVDTSTPSGKLFFTMLAAFAEWERSQLSERTAAGLKQARREGKHTARAPYGTKHDDTGRLVAVPFHAAGALALLAMWREKIPAIDQIPLLHHFRFRTGEGLEFTEQRIWWLRQRMARRSYTGEVVEAWGRSFGLAAVAGVAPEAPAGPLVARGPTACGGEAFLFFRGPDGGLLDPATLPTDPAY